MEHPVLRVKKDAEIYIDPKAEPLVESTGPEVPRTIPPRGLFFRPYGRRRRFPLYAALFAVLVALILPRALFRGSDRGSVAGWSAVLRATPSADSIFASVALSRGPRGEASPTVTVIFSSPQTGESKTVSKTFASDHLILRAILSHTGKEKRVEAEVRIGSASRSLSRVVGRP
jgi:hypothetical protein